MLEETVCGVTWAVFFEAEDSAPELAGEEGDGAHGAVFPI